LRELGVEVDAFVGASIGAIIAGFLAQGLSSELEELGRTITLGDVLDLPPELSEGGEVRLDRESLAAVRELFRKAMAKKGLDTSPLKRLLSERLDEGAIRRGGKDLGIVTVNLSGLEPREVFIEDMEPGCLVDYLLASAAFPGFERPRIAGDQYSDGGMYDNVPYAMARRRGYRRIIVSDVSGLGRNRAPRIEGTLTVYVKNSIEMGGVLDFDRAFLDKFTLLGYLDAMRAFGRLEGYSYFVSPDPAAEASCAPPPSLGPRDYPERMRHDRRSLLKGLECAAACLEIERVRAYGYAELREAVLARAAEVDAKIAALGDAAGLMRLAAPLREAVSKRRFEECPLYYYRLAGLAVPGSGGALLEKALVGFFPELPAGSAWIDALRAAAPPRA
jgi:NTE family protein